MFSVLSLKAKLIAISVLGSIILLSIGGIYLTIKLKNKKIAQLQTELLMKDLKIKNFEKNELISGWLSDLNNRLGKELHEGLRVNKNTFSEIEKEFESNYDNAQTEDNVADTNNRSKVVIDSIWKSFEAAQ